MLIGLRSLWESGVTPPPPVYPPFQITQSGVSGPAIMLGKPKRKKPKHGWIEEEMEEDEIEEILALLGIDI